MAAPPMACNRTRRKPAGLTPSMFTFGFGQRTKTGRFSGWLRMNAGNYKENGFFYAVRN
jgi:hypothetical protein